MNATALTLVTLMVGLKPSLPPESGPPAPKLPPATAPRPPENENTLRLTFGGGAAYRHVADSTGPAFPLELTLVTPPFSVSTGVVFTGDGLAHAYGELGLYFGLSLAVGLGYGAYQTPEGRKEDRTTHLFIGLPIPLSQDEKDVIDAKWFPYLMPYYRPSWGPWPGVAHEAGCMLKFSYTLIMGRWQLN